MRGLGVKRIRLLKGQRKFHHHPASVTPQDHRRCCMRLFGSFLSSSKFCDSLLRFLTVLDDGRKAKESEGGKKKGGRKGGRKEGEKERKRNPLFVASLYVSKTLLEA